MMDDEEGGREGGRVGWRRKEGRERERDKGCMYAVGRTDGRI